MLLPGRNALILIDLLQDNDRNIVDQLGGTPEAVAAGRVKTAFEHGLLDISTFRPDPPYGDAVATVDGQLERVLSSHQILCGKLERVDQMLVRDVFDVLTADDEQSVPPRSPRRHGLQTTGRVHLSGPRPPAFLAHRYTRPEVDLQATRSPSARASAPRPAITTTGTVVRPLKPPHTIDGNRVWASTARPPGSLRRRIA